MLKALGRYISQPARLTNKRNYASDTHLRAVFDQHVARNLQAGPKVKGLFGYTNLIKPQDLIPLAQRTVHRASAVVERICNLPTTFAKDGTTSDQALLLMAKQFDRLSDLLCSVIDPCEFIRNVHADEDWVEAANEVYEYMCNYMNTLNTHVGLYRALSTIMHPFRQTRIPDHLFAAYQVSMQFLRDFEKSGIALPDVKRHQFVQLSDAAILLGRTFLQPPETSSSILSLSDRDASALGNSFKSRLARSGDNYEILVQSAETQAIAQNHPYEGVRRRAWEALNRIGSEHVKVLDELLQVRAATAHLLGKQSWAHVILEDKMAESPDNVMSFLDGLSKHNASEMRNEVELLRGAKKVQRASEPSDIAIWDRDYYSSLTSTIPTSARSYRSFFSVGTVIEGLSRLFSSLFGVSFQHVEPDANESFWHSTVRKLEVVDERNGKLGYIYCDLFSRPGKPHGAAHYTIRCSRRTDDDDSDGDLAFGQDIPPITSLVQPGNTIRKGREGRWQLPTVVLSCDFDFSADQVATLNWNEVETLFHEVGHAIHCKFVRLCKVHVLTDTSAMQGQVEYHNVSGTRCATDFVELPSILMEHFCSSPQVLSLYARHHSTDAPLPHQFLSDIKSSSFPAFEQAHQITLAALDQAYHSSAPLEQPKWNSTETWYEIYEKYGTGCKGLRGSGTNWQTRFTHLVGYGASYYSYLFDRVIASQVWLQIFKASGGLSREAGEKYRREVLQHGGGKDPWQCLASLLENENIAKGGIEAMVEVGKWGINAPT